uniref:Secreted protein n=1 Tax=Macrostomum lignano TaxID=282301 RepID=A0A1I8JJ45_9PLAT
MWPFKLLRQSALAQPPRGWPTSAQRSSDWTLIRVETGAPAAWSVRAPALAKMASLPRSTRLNGRPSSSRMRLC